MIHVLAGAFSLFGALFAHDLAAQALTEKSSLRPLRGTCPRCGEPRGWQSMECPRCGRRLGREVWVLLVTVVVGVGLSASLGARWALIPYLLFLVLTVALVLTDIDALRIVDRLNLPGTALVVVALGIAALAEGSLGAFWRGLLGGLAYFVGTNLLFLLVRGRGFGYGDVKLSFQLGVFTAFLSWGTLGWSVFFTAILGGLISIVVLVVAGARARLATQAGEGKATFREAMRTELPYGPSMVLGAWVAIVLAGLGAFPIPT